VAIGWVGSGSDSNGLDRVSLIKKFIGLWVGFGSI
jgi:hypothetical protein